MCPSDTELATHFAFGENWESYSRLINAEKVNAAVEGMSEFVGPLVGAAFLDIGCGSGLSSLAAARLGVASVMAIDIDPKSAETTRNVLSKFASNISWKVETISVLSDDFASLGQFDVVYSWGVLHHTGNMREAIRKAAMRVRPGGLFAIAIYRKTPFCGVWRLEKRIYTNSHRVIQELIFWAYKISVGTLGWMRRTVTRAAKKPKRRGMDVDHDIRDWLGGYPYESATPIEVDEIVLRLGFRKVREDVPPTRFLGVFGTGCAEYLYQRS